MWMDEGERRLGRPLSERLRPAGQREMDFGGYDSKSWARAPKPRHRKVRKQAEAVFFDN